MLRIISPRVITLKPSSLATLNTIRLKSTQQSPPPKKGKNSLFETEKAGESYEVSTAWQHAEVSQKELHEAGVAHHKPKDFSDRVARNLLLTIRWVFDRVTGYTHPPPGQENNKAYQMSPDKWMQRFIILESVAGCPGFVAAMVRHLHSLRLFRKDRGFIESLLEEAYNERMHLLTFIQLAKPGWITRTMVLAGQGVFFNTFFLAYLINPKICHRFVGYLEEEAVVTYSRCIEELEKGWYPEWQETRAPQIAINYWHMPQDSKLLDLLYYVRADECHHMEVNHTFGNLKPNDPNPYEIKKDKDEMDMPRKDLKNHAEHPVGWERDEIPRL